MKAGWVVSAIVLALVATVATSTTATDVAWMQTYDGASTAARSLARDGDGNILVTGIGRNSLSADYDYTTIKYLPNGDTAWVRKFNSAGSVNDFAVKVGVDDLGNVYVTGHADPMIGTPDKTVVTVKYDPLGNILWQAKFDAEFPADSNRYAVPTDMVVDATGNAYICGYISGPGVAKDALVMKLRPNGDTAWVRLYGGVSPGSAYTDTLGAIAVDGAGNVYATGSTGWVTNSYVLTLAYDATGNSLWTSVLEVVMPPEFGDDVGNDIAVDNAGAVYVAGTAGSVPLSDVLTIKFRPNGDTAWMRRYDGLVHNYQQGLRVGLDSDGVIFVGGRTQSTIYANQYLALRYTALGTLAWATIVGNESVDDRLTDMAVTPEGWVWLTGTSLNAGSNWNWLTIRLNPWGDSTWSHYYVGPGPVEYDTDIPAAIVASDSTQAWVTGLMTTEQMGSDFLTIAYALHCCRGQVGNIDGDPGDVFDISDLQALVDYLFFGGSITPCLPEADVDLSGAIDIGDLQRIVDGLFFGEMLPDCP